VVSDSRDWLGASTAQIVQNVTVGYTDNTQNPPRFYPGMAQSTPDAPAILAFHDGGGYAPTTLAALQPIVDWMNTNNFCSAPVRASATGGLVPAPAKPEPATGNLVVNPSLETLWGSNGNGFSPTMAKCFDKGGYGTPGTSAAFTTTTNPALAHTGNDAQNVTVSGWTSGDSKFIIVQRGVSTGTGAACTPNASANQGHTYTVWVWYKGTWPGYGASTDTTKVGFVVYYRNSSDAWITWASSPLIPPSSGWSLASFTTPPLPAGATGVSFGLAIAGNGNLTTDDYAMVANP
jgi:hypothetical protein